MMLLQKRLKPSCNIPRQTPQILGHSRDLYAWQNPFTRNAMRKKNTYHVALHCNHCYSCFHIGSQERFKVCKFKCCHKSPCKRLIGIIKCLFDQSLENCYICQGKGSLN